MTGMSYLRPLLSVRLVKRNAFLILRCDAAAELPSHEGVHLGVFVNQPVDLDEKPRLAKRFDMLVQIGIDALRGLCRGSLNRCAMSHFPALPLLTV